MTRRWRLALLVAATWIAGAALFAATPTPAPTSAPQARDERHAHPTAPPRATAQDSGRHDSDSTTDDGTLRRLFRSLDDSHRDRGDQDHDDSAPSADGHRDDRRHDHDDDDRDRR